MKYSQQDAKELLDAGSVKVYDFGDTVADRYTVWLSPAHFPLNDWGITGFAMSDHPNHPQGFNQCICDPIEEFLKAGRDKLLATAEVSAYVIAAIADRLSD